jgi:hypothetical protein
MVKRQRRGHPNLFRQLYLSTTAVLSHLATAYHFVDDQSHMTGISPSSRAHHSAETMPGHVQTLRAADTHRTATVHSTENGKSVMNPVHTSRATFRSSLNHPLQTPPRTCATLTGFYLSHGAKAVPCTRREDVGCDSEATRRNSQTNILHKTVLYPNPPSYHYCLPRTTHSTTLQSTMPLPFGFVRNVVPFSSLSLTPLAPPRVATCLVRPSLALACIRCVILRI